MSFEPPIRHNSAFLIGPSGIGKSTIGRMLAEEYSLKYLSIDEIALEFGASRGFIDPSSISAFDLYTKVGEKAFFMMGITELYKILGARKSERLVVVDIGAAFQNVELIASLAQFESVICLTATCGVSYSRFANNRLATHTVEEHERVEFSHIRNIVYQSATYTIDTSQLSASETLAAVANYLRLG